MCGIVGYISSDNIDLSNHLKKIYHRGPDFSDVNYDFIENKYIGLGHVRLSIIDTTSHANQPFYFEDKYVFISNFNIIIYFTIKN